MYHVIPRNDLEEHIESEYCHCSPTLTEFGIIVHNSFDGREGVEWAMEILNNG